MDQRCSGSRLAFGRLALVLLVMGMTGCGGIVYKDSAVTYVAAGRAATKAVADAANSLTDGRNMLIEGQIVKDASCPIAEKHIYLRSPTTTAVVKAGIERLWGKNLGESYKDCKALLTCDDPDETKKVASCRGICYSAAEANCIATVEEKTAQQLGGLKGDEADRYSAEVKPLAEALASAEYGRAPIVQVTLIDESVTALTAYLDLLDKAAKSQQNEIAVDAKKLSDHVTNASTKLQGLAGKTLSTNDQAIQTKVTNAITGLGKLAGDLKQIEVNAKDAAAIQKIVSERSATVTSLVDQIRTFATGDEYLGASRKDRALKKMRHELQEQWARVSPAERDQLLDQRKRLDYEDADSLSAGLDTLFDAMNKSHAALVRLVLNPSDEDKKTLANAAFQEFKLVAGDVSSLLKAFH